MPICTIKDLVKEKLLIFLMNLKYFVLKLKETVFNDVENMVLPHLIIYDSKI